MLLKSGIYDWDLHRIWDLRSENPRLPTPDLNSHPHANKFSIYIPLKISVFTIPCINFETNIWIIEIFSLSIIKKTLNIVLFRNSREYRSVKPSLRFVAVEANL